MAKAGRKKPTTKQQRQGFEPRNLKSKSQIANPKSEIGTGSQLPHDEHKDAVESAIRNPQSAIRNRTRRLFVDLEVCLRCPECVTKCDYFYHPGNNGMLSVRERAAMSVVCRRCENPLCVSVCTKDALEKGADGVLRRHTMRCVGCKSCSVACPFGTLFPDVVPYAVSLCDYCAGRLREDEAPVCVESCPYAAVRFDEVDEDIAGGIHRVDDSLIVHALPWKKETVKK